MRINFIKNNYLLIWNLLYGPSISIKTHAFKQKLWLTYKKEYKALASDKDEILMDIKNYIPNNNTLYDKIEDLKIFETLEKEAEKHRLELMKIWDFHKKRLIKEFDNIFRMKLDTYQVVVLPPAMETCLAVSHSSTIGWGKKKDLEDGLYTILQIVYQFIKKQVAYTEKLDQDIAESILELATLNECYTRIKESNYLTGNKELVSLKKELYPYFLMYLGIDLEATPQYMRRDNMAFDMEKYTNEIQLRNLNILEFIDFVVRNKKVLLRIKKETVEIL